MDVLLSVIAVLIAISCLLALVVSEWRDYRKRAAVNVQPVKAAQQKPRR